MVPKIEKGREYTNSELISICTMYGREDLVHLLTMSPFTKPFKSDFCSMFPDEIDDVDFGECCFFHDISYGCGGTKLMRFRADSRLVNCVATKFSMEDKEDEGIKLAMLMLDGVRVGGTIGPWAWGFMRE